MLETLEKLEELKKEVSKWSLHNFGHNGMWDKHYLPSFLGIVEEVGELKLSTNEEETKDALSDICIFAMDFAGRKVIDLKTLDIPKVSIPTETIDSMLSILVGQLSQHLLKEIQAIKGYENKDFAKSQIEKTFAELLALVNYICELEFNTQMYYLAKETWDKIVSKRNWKSE